VNEAERLKTPKLHYHPISRKAYFLLRQNDFHCRLLAGSLRRSIEALALQTQDEG
jgi:hypothetical protein